MFIFIGIYLSLQLGFRMSFWERWYFAIPTFVLLIGVLQYHQTVSVNKHNHPNTKFILNTLQPYDVFSQKLELKHTVLKDLSLRGIWINKSSCNNYRYFSASYFTPVR